MSAALNKLNNFRSAAKRFSANAIPSRHVPRRIGASIEQRWLSEAAEFAGPSNEKHHTVHVVATQSIAALLPHLPGADDAGA